MIGTAEAVPFQNTLEIECFRGLLENEILLLGVDLFRIDIRSLLHVVDRFESADLIPVCGDGLGIVETDPEKRSQLLVRRFVDKELRYLRRREVRGKIVRNVGKVLVGSSRAEADHLRNGCFPAVASLAVGEDDVGRVAPAAETKNRLAALPGRKLGMRVRLIGFWTLRRSRSLSLPGKNRVFAEQPYRDRADTEEKEQKRRRDIRRENALNDPLHLDLPVHVQNDREDFRARRYPSINCT
jgi:hypothetical protein